mmetsp:Transcript_35237/g.77627  ORF Transcript_35237/g.77627 Transcript_35237/m.77627 type:complete len:119 (-) Transcript_35237:126-482(-)|eukprot:CAMPEP_0173180642 /NCGR_PEP_ID=MMETSP1141-20130122/6828_1 /TAXON_ID=483371 /ORGANISM="non described non described, Strain CCMP2298" /LENGTH=118 /DNA_ID=CAMNT_0014103513 /DNA_START=46 /DNA_END=402 /DNA_ORIENTATION=+
MEHMFAAMNMGRKPSNQEEGRAPIELLSEFLLAVQDRKMHVALELAEKLLEFEPENKMIHEYQVNIKKFIDQGLEEEDDEEEEEEEEDSDEEQDDSSDEEGEGKESESMAGESKHSRK